ncbi:MAG: GNAT family N-acetyltransferase [Bacteroidota bacterium]
MTKVQRATKNTDYEIIAGLAVTIWHGHYTPIIGVEQVNYMLQKFQSVAAIKAQIKKGASYYMIMEQECAVGYLSFFKNKESLFLSKIYILSNLRGRGIGRTAISFIENSAQELACNTISLTVNRHNTASINAYEKMGFKKMKPMITDIGKGFVMDDYYMEKKL